MGEQVPYKLCRDILGSIDGALGIAFADIPTGLPLALEARPDAPLGPMALEMLVAFGVACFERAPPTAEDAVQEVQATIDDNYCFMVRIPDAPDRLLLLLLDTETTNLGLGWTLTRQAVERIRAMPKELLPANGSADASPDFGGARPVPDRVPARRARGRRSIWD